MPVPCALKFRLAYFVVSLLKNDQIHLKKVIKEVTNLFGTVLQELS